MEAISLEYRIEDFSALLLLADQKSQPAQSGMGSMGTDLTI